MTTRTDVLQDFEEDPRISTVEAPSVEYLMQDVVDTTRKAEDSFQGMSFNKLLDAGGKEDLGGGLTVGITVTLQNNVVEFEARRTPAVEGTVTTQGLTDARNLVQLIDTGVDFVAANVQPGSFVINFTDQSVTDVRRVVDTDQLECKALVNGNGNTFEVGDEYHVFNIVQCDATGGNLVGVDEFGATISPILPSAFTQVLLSRSSSATLLGSDKIDDIHGQTEREIYIDQDALTNGVGYQQSPYDNWSDAVDDAENRGLLSLVIKSDAIVDRQIRNFSIRGITFPTLDLNGQDMGGTTVSAMNITGTHLGSMLAQDIGMSSVSGEVLVQRVAISGTYLVRGGSFSILTTVAPLIPGQPWVLDLGLADTASVVGIADISGGMSVANMDQAGDTVHIHFNSGVLVIDATCTDGNIVVTGLVEVIDNSAGTTVDISAIINISVVGAAPWDALTADHTTVGTFGEKVGQKLLTFAKWIGVRGGSGK